MEITWLGHSCFRLRGRGAAIGVDPGDSSTGNTIGRPTAAIVTVSHEHPGHSNVGAVQGTPRVVEGPGEFEISGVMIKGIRTYHDGEKGTKLGKNTAFVFE